MNKSAKEMFKDLGYACWETPHCILYDKFHGGIKNIKFIFKTKIVDIDSYFSIEEHKAIHQQMKELGWL